MRSVIVHQQVMLLLLSTVILHLSFAFQPRHNHHHLSLFTSSAALGGDGGEVRNEDEMERMDIVRMLQRSYYRSDDVDRNETTISQPYKGRRTILDVDTGRVSNLPLWRVGWVETPGRRNCLNVHELQYTHMFETILSSTNGDDDDGLPLYFGHLYLPGGTSSALSGEERYRLKTWREELVDVNRFEDYTSSSTLAAPELKSPTVDRSAVIGCIMQILDHRRLDDGRLVILVQAVERFVVEEIVKTKPYAVANVQILLDKEELPWEKGYKKTSSNEGAKKLSNVAMDDEGKCKFIRGKAVAASFGYHEYEFDKQKLPGWDGDGNKEMYLTKLDVPWIQISQLLPFATYSSNDQCLVAANSMTAHIMDDAILTVSNKINLKSANGDLPVEQELWNGGILWEPPRVLSTVDHVRRDDLDCDALETLLWLALEEFCRGTGFVLPNEVRCLMPPEMDYLDFTTSKCILSMYYPKRRRQRRLSYLAPAIIENVVLPMKGRRQIWLNAPSIAARLLDTLEWYDYLNNKIGLEMGEFE